MSEATESDRIIFISYRRTDARWPADRLVKDLEDAFGEPTVFLDARDIHAGSDFTEVIEDQLSRAGALLVLIGEKWLRAHDEFFRRRLDREDDWLRHEIRTGLAKADCSVIPVLLDEAQLPHDEEAFPADISKLVNRQSRRLRQESSKADIDVLIEELEALGFRRLSRSRPDDAAEYADSIVNNVAAHVRMLLREERDEAVRRRKLLRELELLFNRKTFREATRNCLEQRWGERLDAAQQTFDFLEQNIRTITDVMPEQFRTLRELAQAVDKYCMNMGALLFTSQVDHDKADAHIGKPTFRAQLPPELRFPAGPDRHPIIEDAVNDNIETHRLRALELIDGMAANEAAGKPRPA